MSNEFASSAYTAGQLNAMVKLMKKQEGDNAPERFLRGELQFVTIKHVIDLDADPFVPDGFSVEEHQKGGSFEWNPDEVKRFLTKVQEEVGYIVGNDLRKEHEGKNPYNANLLDYLLAHPDLIPEDWKGKLLYFLGTIYRDSGLLGVRCLSWDGGEWNWRCYWLGNDFDGWGLSAVSART